MRLPGVPEFPRRMQQSRAFWAGVVAVFLAGPFIAASADPMSDLEDAQARAEYAFYTGDSRSLDEIVRAVEQLSVPPQFAALKAYDAAYGQWKLAQLYADEATRNTSRATLTAASKALQACLTHTATALATDERMVEAYVLDAACAIQTVDRRVAHARASKSNCARNKSLRTAQQLQSDNPRVLLITAMCQAFADPVSAKRVDSLRAVVAAFEAAPLSRPGHPDWGQAESLLMLGDSLLQEGDTRAARDAIEKALVIAPDYRKARELLGTADARPR